MSDEERPELTVDAWQPKPELYGMVHRALTQMAHTWPKAFVILNQKSEASREFVVNFCFALRFVDWRAIQPTTREWLATEKFAPKPAEFAMLARTISAKHFPKFREQDTAKPQSLWAGATVHWYESPGRDQGYGRLDVHRAVYFKLRTGVLLNISAHEYEQVEAKKLMSGPLRISEVPELAAPAEFFAAHKQQGAA